MTKVSRQAFGYLITAALITIAGCSKTPSDAGETATPTDSEAVTYTNAYWYSTRGQQTGFTLGERYVSGNRFVATPIPGAKEIDLGGAFVVPPFGEAHNYSVDGPVTAHTAQHYIEQGVFYYKNPISTRAVAEPMLEHWRQANTLDLSLSFGGIVLDEDYPRDLYRSLTAYGLYADIDSEQLDGQLFFDVATEGNFDAEWATILAGKPDFLQLYLLDHTGIETEDRFRQVVTRAQQAGLRTSVRIKTVEDLALALDAGADEATALPAYDLEIARNPTIAAISDELIREMAKQRFVVVAADSFSERRDYSPSDLDILIARQTSDLQRLHRAEVPLAIGSSSYFRSPWDEVQALKRQGVFDDATLTRLWIETPALSIFPERNIGRLEPDYEASFLALRCNPLVSINCTQSILLGVKEGLTVID